MMVCTCPLCGAQIKTPQGETPSCSNCNKGEDSYLYPKVIPWIECNVNDSGVIAYTRDGLVEWSAISREAIVTTLPDLVDDVFPPLLDAAIKIIPSLKPPFGRRTHRLHELYYWERLAESVQEALAVCDANHIMLECETMTEGLVRGDRVDMDAVTRGVELLPCTTYIIYPEPLGQRPETHRLLQFSQAVASGLMENACPSICLWTDRRMARPRSWEYEGTQRSYRYMEALRADYGNPHADPLYTTFYCGEGETHWHDADMVKAMRHVTPPNVMVPYPTFARWPESGAIVAEFLKAGYPRREGA